MIIPFNKMDSNLVFCSKCGKQLKEGTKFCPYCGASIFPVKSTGMPSLKYADLGERFIAILIDTIITFIVAAIISFPLGLLAFPFPFSLNFFTGGLQIINWLIWIAYFTYLEGTTGQTLGKQLVNIKVVDSATGENLHLDKSLIRNILRIVDFLPFLYIVGAILISTSERKQRLGDIVTGSVVVKS